MRRMICVVFLLTVMLTVVFVSQASAQSGPPMLAVRSQIPNESTSDPAAVQRVIAGSSYMSIQVIKTRINSKSSWWKRLIEKDRKAVVSVAVSGMLNNQPLNSTRVSPAIELSSSQTQDLSWNVPIVENLPAAFSSLTIDFKVLKTSRNGLSDLLSVVSTLSNKIPPFKLAPQTLGSIEVLNKLIDVTLGSQFAEMKLQSTGCVVADDVGFPSGYYVFFASGDPKDYNLYVNSRDQLVWNGANLLFGTEDILDSSYVVLKITARERLCKDADTAITLYATRPWASLYRKADVLAANLKDLGSLSNTTNQIQQLLLNAHELFAEDLEFTNSEKKIVYQGIKDDISDQLTRRVKYLSQDPTSDHPIMLSVPLVDFPGEQ